MLGSEVIGKLYLLKTKALLLCIALHVPHESVPLEGASHNVFCFYPVRLAVDEFSCNIHGGDFAFIVYHVQARYVATLLGRLKHCGRIENKRRCA